MTDVTERRRRDFDRLLTFVDAIVAIAITLLVLPLAELSSDIGDQPVSHLLRTHQGQFFSFLLSFAVIARLWFAQHESLRNVLIAPDRLGVLLMVWTATIVFLPFPTALLADAGSQVLTKVLYIGTITLNVAVVAAMDLLVRRHPTVTGGQTPPDLASAVINVILLVSALILALLLPGSSYYTLLLLTLDRPILSLWHRKRGRAPA
ncbi:MAG TPA: TMEM175 family protein [Mycobacteriales bacterium]|nr:TMEM175 family protein [Mycobacteriales bacterium]